MYRSFYWELFFDLSITGNVLWPWDFINVHFGLFRIGQKFSDRFVKHWTVDRGNLKAWIGITVSINKPVLHAWGWPGPYIASIPFYLFNGLNSCYSVLFYGCSRRLVTVFQVIRSFLRFTKGYNNSIYRILVIGRLNNKHRRLKIFFQVCCIL